MLGNVGSVETLADGFYWHKMVGWQHGIFCSHKHLCNSCLSTIQLASHVGVLALQRLCPLLPVAAYRVRAGGRRLSTCLSEMQAAQSALHPSSAGHSCAACQCCRCCTVLRGARRVGLRSSSCCCACRAASHKKGRQCAHRRLLLRLRRSACIAGSACMSDRACVSGRARLHRRSR